jgi:hypothetical protein
VYRQPAANPIQHPSSKITITKTIGRSIDEPAYTIIDITDTHDEIDLPSDYIAIMEPLIKRLNIPTNEIHTMLYNPVDLLIGLNNESLYELSHLDYNWVDFGAQILNCTICRYRNPNDTIENRLEILISYFALNQNCKLNFFIDDEFCAQPDSDVKTFLNKIPLLFDLGFVFSGKQFTSKLFVEIVDILDENYVQQLIDCGFDLEESIRKNIHKTTKMKVDQLLKLLKFYPKPEEIMRFIMICDPKVAIYKMFAKMYNVDVTTLLLE